MRYDIPLYPDKPDEPDPDECVIDLSGLDCSTEEKIDAAFDEIKSRILAAVQPKRWPLVLDGDWMIDCDKSGVVFLENGRNVCALADYETDRFCVTWLAGRGVDLQHVSDCLADMGRLPQYRMAIDAILSNARGEA